MTATAIDSAGSMAALGARIVVAGVASGVGKTTVATGLMAALRARGLAVANAKVGPDFIDPGYHALATGRPPRNLDPWLSGPDAIADLAGRAAHGADVLVVEGVMGMFDGADDGSPSSTADVAALIEAPVVLVVDVAAMSSSIAAVVRGFRDHDERLHLGGVICNRVGSERHEFLLREALEPLGVPVLGCMPRDDGLTWRDRHLGLVPVAERPDDVRRSLDRLSAMVAAHIDLDGVMQLARSAPGVPVGGPELPGAVGRCRIAVAAGAAFTFAYTDNLEAMAVAGAEVVPFDPLHDASLPVDVDAMFIGGGFPEVFGEQLAANEPLRADVNRRVGAGLATWAECGGLLWLAGELDGRRMVGAVPTTATLGRRLTLGYRTATTTVDSVVGRAGTTFRGHEFHYSTCAPTGDALWISSRQGSGGGFASPTLLASYVHHHAGGDPSLVEAFVAAAVRSRCPSSP
ncbi:MAG: cobyrinate a,c-diamide synthase [Acidimicrobiales bacterium]|nr:cobyrinate a,c-diamide synthase [Acidimicrobiales bacterium]